MVATTLDATVIRSYIAKTGMKQYEFTDAIGFNYSNFNNKLNGFANWQLSDLIALADFFGCSTDELLGRTEYLKEERG